ncbi:NAD-binding homoserine dehydrogenase [Aureimonas sp. SA4125]|uniref:flagellar biosynthesis protein FlgA n=1 Tax=Aureimonas sp. SA4125 TaxID=2826993 RepID=UPI001CC69BFC|nr:flagellar biosynthesis protein FlgA [Aureimonas sp. SA4125]BDA83004.1 NAD-binding homoserine dehydrogenase [Aureimonas sp. SA4125]
MNHHSYFRADGRIVETCVVGTGGFGRSFIAQGLHVPLMNVRVAVDVTAAAAAAALRAVGIAPASIAECGDAAEATAAWAAGHFIAAGDLAVVLHLPIDVVVEATGHPEAGARHARLAIEAKRHVALVSKEVDSVVGPGLAHLAAAQGVIVTPVDGDQPSLLIGLVTWAEVLGFDIVAAGKSSEYDFCYDPATGRLSSNGTTVDAPAFSGLLELGDHPVGERVAARSQAAAALPQRAVPDLCELGVAANAVDLVPDVPALHCPILRTSEVASVFSTVADGGILSGERRIDVFHCLRLPGEISFAGGVFVVVRCRDGASWDMLRDKGHILSRNGRTAMLYIPRHLLGLEAATSILEVALRGTSSGAERPLPRLDLVAVAEADLAAGTMLSALGHHHTIADVGAALHPAGPLSADRAAPYYLVADKRLARPVAMGQVIRLGDIAMPESSELLALRRLQDGAFPAKAET